MPQIKLMAREPKDGGEWRAGVLGFGDGLYGTRLGPNPALNLARAIEPTNLIASFPRTLYGHQGHQ